MSKGDKKKKEEMRRVLHEKREAIVKEIEEHIGSHMSTALLQKFDSALDDGDISVLSLGEGIDYKLLEMKYKE